MDLNTLKLFKKIADKKSFLTASQELEMSPVVLTRKIARFEKELGQKLMSRSRAGVFLTEEGESLYEIASSIEALEKEGEEKIYNSTKELKGDIRIQTTTGTLNSWLTDAAVDFSEINPGIQLNILSTNDPLGSANHFSDVIIGPLKKEDEHLERIYIRTYSQKFYASEGYIKKFGRPKSKEDFDNHRLISFSNGEPAAFGDVDKFLIGRDGKKRKAYMNINSSNGLLRAAELGAGIIYLGKEFLEENNVDLVDVFPTSPFESLDIYYLFHKNLKPINRIISFGNFLRNRFVGLKS